MESTIFQTWLSSISLGLQPRSKFSQTIHFFFLQMYQFNFNSESVSQVNPSLMWEAVLVVTKALTSFRNPTSLAHACLVPQMLSATVALRWALYLDTGDPLVNPLQSTSASCKVPVLVLSRLKVIKATKPKALVRMATKEDSVRNVRMATSETQPSSAADVLLCGRTWFSSLCLLWLWSSDLSSC